MLVRGVLGRDGVALKISSEKNKRNGRIPPARHQLKRKLTRKTMHKLKGRFGRKRKNEK
jgi:hypothetical protein